MNLTSSPITRATPSPITTPGRRRSPWHRSASAVCLFGSATPDLGSLHNAQSGTWQKLTLPARILAHTETVASYDKIYHTAARYQQAGDQAAMTDLPAVNLVDMREELKAGNRSIFSRRLQEKLADVLDKEQQAILFLNRRGSATYVFCRDCGHTLKCPRCSTNLTYYLGGIHRPGENHPARVTN